MISKKNKFSRAARQPTREFFINGRKNKFFIKKGIFWVLVILNWIFGIVISKNFSLRYIVASFFGSFILIFILGLFVWIIIKIVKKIKNP